jgi:hypothetical protein
MTEELKIEAASQSKAPRDRSPSYPFISLKIAIDRTAALEAKFGRHPPPADKAGMAWGMKENISQSFQTLAAMKSFGLVEYRSPNGDRHVALTDDARNYFRAQQASVKAEILKSCALRPKAIQTYWSAWGYDRPIDAVCLDQLVIKDGYTQSAASTFLRVYDETVAFAGLAGGNTVESSDQTTDEEPAEPLDIQQTTVSPAIATGSGRPSGQSTNTATTLRPLASSLDDKYELGDGRAFVLRWPTMVSAAEFEEFEAWIALLQKKLKRSVQR